ncbi:SPOR domain-containing protein [Sulfitobacter sp. JB4-11]|uniref:SPOR domain-containing protein n=1 Tax=Sulfitobacter rhodophyticola TaxID=3238304 RepID=UPI003511B22C
MSSISTPMMDTRRGPFGRKKLFALGVAATIILAGCDDAGNFSLSMPEFGGGGGSEAAAGVPAASAQTVERDVEAPEVFNVSDQGLWDGRPSLGGVWVAHPDVSEPERVIIRNEANGKFVIGALFRRERDLPGPKLQISSDAAASLDILAGAPAPLNVTALRREEAEVPTTDAAPEDITEVAGVAAPADVAETTLDPIASAGAAIDAAAPTTTETAAAAPAPAPAPAPVAKPSNLAKPFIQIGIFSVEANANRAAKQMQSAGMVPTVKKSEINGKPFWRVVVGPANTKSELNSILKNIKAEGFSDAYAVSN